MILRWIWILSLLMLPALHAQTVDEKKAGLAGQDLEDFDTKTQLFLNETNQSLAKLKMEARGVENKILALQSAENPSEELEPLIEKLTEIRKNIRQRQFEWQQAASNIMTEEAYALWNQPSTTIEQLVSDYGSPDYVYLIPQEIASIKVSISSSIPVPRESWEEILELVLSNSGVGVQQLNPLLRRLYLLNQNQSYVKLITDQESDLDTVSPTARVFFMMAPEEVDVRGLFQILQKFVKNESTSLNMIGSDLFVLGTAAEVKELLKVYRFMETNRSNKDYRLIPLKKGDPDELSNILQTMFSDRTASTSTSSSTPPLTSTFNRSQRDITRTSSTSGQSRRLPPQAAAEIEGGSLTVIPLRQIGPAIFLMGTRSQVEKAEQILQELENQIGQAQDKTIYYYRCKHSVAEELAPILEKVYYLIVTELKEHENSGETPLPNNTPQELELVRMPERRRIPSPNVYDDGISIVVKPDAVDPSKVIAIESQVSGNNFIVDPKTGSIIMVVEPYALGRLKELLRKIDIPKKMVRIDVLLFEKRVTTQNNFGLNLLRLGDKATNKHITGWTWNTNSSGVADNSGLLSFMFSRKSGTWEAIDLVYNFLLSRDDIQVNSNPSITTLNQTPAKINVVEEISINTGVTELDPERSSALKDSYVRAQYGISIVVTPTIHEWECDEESEDPFMSYITLETNVNFDTPGVSTDDRPPILRRSLSNEVSVANGETIILGGLRRKQLIDGRKSIPFLGEMPGVGKFFSTTDMNDQTSEMFVCLTPTIIEDPYEDVRRARWEECRRRPGDLPDFLICIEEAKACEKKRVFNESIKMLFGRPEKPCVLEECGGEYDGWD